MFNLLAITLGFYSALATSNGSSLKKGLAPVSEKPALAVVPAEPKKEEMPSDSNTVQGSSIAVPPSNLKQKSFTMFGDFLYWRADEDGLSYGQTLRNQDYFKGKDPHFRWSPGFRFGIGSQMGSSDQWDVSAVWTSFNTHARGSVDTHTTDPDLDDNFIFVPRWNPEILGASAARGSADWKLRYHTIDVALGRNYFISRKLSVHPQMGLRGAWINQDYDAKYLAQFSTSFPSGLTTSLLPSSFDGDVDFKGVGMRANVDLEYHFTPHFAFCGNMGGSLFYGWFHVKEKFKGWFSQPQGSIIANNTTFDHHFQRTRANLEGALGFIIEGDMGASSHIRFTLKYEFSEWFSQNMLADAEVVPKIIQSNTTDDVLITNTRRAKEDGSNLGLQGLTAELRFDF